MMNNPIDLPRIRRALNRLDQIAADHPERLHKGKPWTNELNQLQETLMTPGKQRIAEYRARQAAKGLKAVTVYLTPEGQMALYQLQSKRPDSSMGDVISDALIETTKLK